MTNVAVTPHVASNTDKGYWRMSQSVVDQVLRVLAGERPSFLIDLTAWPGRMHPRLASVERERTYVP